MKTTMILCAAILLAAVELSAAATDFDSFVQPDPFVRANAAFARGEVSAAEALIAPLTQGGTPRADTCALLGEIRMNQNRPNDGVALFQRAAILSPKNASYQSRLGNALLQSMEEVDESRRGLLAGQALTALRRSVELDPEDCDGYLGLANYYAATPEIVQKAMGGKAFRIERLNVGTTQNSPPPRLMMAAARASSDAAIAPPPVEAGASVVTVSIGGAIEVQ